MATEESVTVPSRSNRRCVLLRLARAAGAALHLPGRHPPIRGPMHQPKSTAAKWYLAGVSAVVIVCATAGTLVAQQAPAAPRAGQVIGSRSFSPMVEDVDAAMKLYAMLGLTIPAPEKGTTYPWDEEAWHYDLHGGQAPKSQMRFTYANVPGAVPPARPLLVEPVEHRGIDRKVRTPLPQNPGSTTLVVVVRDLDLAVSKLPLELQQPV